MSPVWKFCLGSLLLLAGCHSSTSEEHLEHHVPSHQPPNYPAAVHSLHERLHDMQDAANAETQLAEFREILGWLPEMAANSDLGKDDWDEINAISQQLQKLWAGVSTLPASAEVSQQSHELIEKLEGFEQQAQFDNLPGHVLAGSGHSHHHHHHGDGQGEGGKHDHD